METTLLALAPCTLDHDAPNRDAWSETLCDALARYPHPASDRGIGETRTP